MNRLKKLHRERERIINSMPEADGNSEKALAAIREINHLNRKIEALKNSLYERLCDRDKRFLSDEYPNIKDPLQLVVTLRLAIEAFNKIDEAMVLDDEEYARLTKTHYVLDKLEGRAPGTRVKLTVALALGLIAAVIVTRFALDQWS